MADKQILPADSIMVNPTDGLMDALYAVAPAAPEKKRFVYEDYYCYLAPGQPVHVALDYATDTGLSIDVMGNCPVCDLEDDCCDPPARWSHESDSNLDQFVMCACGWKAQVFYGIPVEFRGVR